MCGTILEILYLVAGIWLIISGKVPNGFFNFLFGKGQYVFSAINARLFGLLLASPLPVVLIVSFLLGMLFGEEALSISVFFEIGYLVVVTIAAIVITRKIRQPESTS